MMLALLGRQLMSLLPFLRGESISRRRCQADLSSEMHWPRLKDLCAGFVAKVIVFSAVKLMKLELAVRRD